MDLSINIQDRGKVTVDSAASFLLELIEKNLITQNGIQWISFDHYDPTINGRIGKASILTTSMRQYPSSNKMGLSSSGLVSSLRITITLMASLTIAIL